MSDVLGEPVLVLNKNWLPIETCSVRRAFEKLFAEKAHFINTEDCSTHDFLSWAELYVPEGCPVIKTSRMHIRAPEVIVLTSAAKTVRKRDGIVFSRRNLIRRDHGVCQYCGEQPDLVDLTIDHIFPKTRGGKSSWTNCVMSCFDCNSFKADRTPEEAGMKLLSRPLEPGWSPLFRVSPNRYKPSWHQFVSKNLVK